VAGLRQAVAFPLVTGRDAPPVFARTPRNLRSSRAPGAARATWALVQQAGALTEDGAGVGIAHRTKVQLAKRVSVGQHGDVHTAAEDLQLTIKEIREA
jgi:hypothetical protein